MGGVRIAALLAAAATLLAPRLRPARRRASTRCGAFLFGCARVSVPLDRSGVTPAGVSLFVKRIRAQQRPRKGALFVLAGGPGQSATEAFEGDGLGVLAPAFRHRDLIVFDQRGTGRSGLLRCRALERSNLFDAGRAAGQCAGRLGARRFHYTSRDSVEDIEALRVALGLDKIALYGTSYGVKVALGYALTYPDPRGAAGARLGARGRRARPVLPAHARGAPARAALALPLRLRLVHRRPARRPGRLVRRMGARGCAGRWSTRAAAAAGPAQPRRAVPDADRRRLRPGAARRVAGRRARRARRRHDAAAAARAALVLGRGRAAAAAAAQHGAVHRHHLRGDALPWARAAPPDPAQRRSAPPRPPPR